MTGAPSGGRLMDHETGMAAVKITAVNGGALWSGNEILTALGILFTIMQIILLIPKFIGHKGESTLFLGVGTKKSG